MIGVVAKAMRASKGQGSSERPATGLWHDVSVRIVKILNVLLMTLPFCCCWFMYYTHQVLMFPSALRSMVVIGMFVVLYCFFARVYDAFLLSIKRLSEVFISQLMSILMADGFMFLILWLMSGSFPNMVPALAALAVQLMLSLVWCRCAHHWYFRHFEGQKTVVVYDMERGLEDLFDQYGLDRKFHVVATCTADECMAARMQMLKGMDAVFLSGVQSHERNQILKYCIAHHVCVYVIPRIGDVIMSGAKRMHMFHLPLLQVGRYNPSPEFLLVKRIFDVVASAAVILVTSPLMAIVAIAIKAQDGGPVFYKQTRLTKDGKEFKILKFRSMRVDAEKDGVARLSTGEKDDRITPVGRVIRACRLDELPQLFNILAGSMSVVGPRPERPEIAKQYEQEMPEFSLRLQAKAGLTGYAQVYGKYNTSPYNKLQMDLMYIANPSLMADLKLIFATLLILFTKESTEGVSEGATTAMAGEPVGKVQATVRKAAE